MKVFTLSDKKNSVIVVIPARNEAENIASILDRTLKLGYKILVVDGHSTDNTVKIAEQRNIPVIYDGGKGKGDAIRTAIKYINDEIVVFMDADGSHSPEDIENLIAPILAGQADQVQGSRALGGSDELWGDLEKFIRSTGSALITLGINYRFGVRLTDSQNGFRAARVSALKGLNLKENITTIEQELVIKSLRAGHRLVEVPTHEYKRAHGRSCISLRRVSWRYFITWLYYLFFD